MLRKSSYILSIIVFVLVFLTILYAIELYSDDFYYTTFLDNGIESFINKNIEHYKNVNGRWFVHLLDEIILKLGKYLYMFFLPSLLLLIFFISAKIFNIKDDILYYISISSFLFLHITVYVLKETSFWITGSFNYIFPMLMSLLSILIMQNILNKNKLSFWQLFLLFLASATTEQGFVMSFLFTVGVILLDALKNKKFKIKLLIPLLVELLGFLSMFLSPASRLRATTSHTIFNYPIYKLFEENFGKLSLTLVGPNSIAILISLLLISIGILYIKDKNLNKILTLGIPLGISIFLLHLLNFFNEISATIATVIIIIYILFSIFVLFKHSKYQMLSLFLIVATCVQGTAFGLGEVSYRTLFPLTLIIILSIANIFSNFNIKIKIPLLLLFFVTGICYITPTCIGYYNNKEIIDDMKESIQNYASTEKININTNINHKYSHIMGYENADFLEYFYKYYGILEYTDNIYYNLNGDASKLFVNDKQIQYSACLDDNNIYLPIRFIIESLGGTCDWNDSNVKYSLNNYYIVIDNISSKIVDCSNSKFIGIDLSNSIKQYLSRSYINLNDLLYFIYNTHCKITIGENVYAF